MKQQLINEIRAFNRLYTQVIGLVNDHILDSDYSLPEARVLYELSHRPGLTASDLTALLGMDKGYLSRVLRRFEEKRLVSRVVSSADRRSTTLSLTAKGKSEFGMLNRASNLQIENAFRNLSEQDSHTLVEKMRDIQRIITQNNILP